MDEEELGTFGDWKPEPTMTCPLCKSGPIKSRSWDSNDGAFTDYQFQCENCKGGWWVEGSDS